MSVNYVTGVLQYCTVYRNSSGAIIIRILPHLMIPESGALVKDAHIKTTDTVLHIEGDIIGYTDFRDIPRKRRKVRIKEDIVNLKEIFVEDGLFEIKGKNTYISNKIHLKKQTRKLVIITSNWTIEETLDEGDTQRQTSILTGVT